MVSANVKGSLYLVLSMAGFTFNDAILKSVGTEISTGQIMFVRGVIATLLLGLLAVAQGALWSSATNQRSDSGMRHPLVSLRGLFELAATIGFLTAVTKLPLANISAILQALPLTITLGAALLFAEPVGWRRWSAIIVGLIGVLIIVRPGMQGFTVYSLIALSVVVFATGRDLVTRKLPTSLPTILVSLVTSTIITITGLAMLFMQGGWQSMDGFILARIAAAAVFILAGYQFVILAMRTGEIASVAPFRYTSLILAIILGYVFFDEVPDFYTVLGATIVVVTGLYTLYREHKVISNH